MSHIKVHAEDWKSRRACISTYWLNKSSDLRAAAGAVWHCMKSDPSSAIPIALGLGKGFSMSVATRPVYEMLCGMALELAFKAVAVSKGKRPISTHNLLKLSEHAEGVPLTAKQKQLLEMLTESIYWQGRYPVPKELKSMDKYLDLARAAYLSPIRIGKFKGFRSNRSDPLDWDRFQSLWAAALVGYVQATE